MKIKKGKKEIDIGQIKKLVCFGKIIGLMFSRREKANKLLFDFKKPLQIKIHSYFVFFPFIAVWLDNKNVVLKIKKVEPFQLINNLKFKSYRLIEIPINNKNKDLIRILKQNLKF